MGLLSIMGHILREYGRVLILELPTKKVQKERTLEYYINEAIPRVSTPIKQHYRHARSPIMINLSDSLTTTTNEEGRDRSFMPIIPF